MFSWMVDDGVTWIRLTGSEAAWAQIRKGLESTKELVENIAFNTHQQVYIEVMPSFLCLAFS